MTQKSIPTKNVSAGLGRYPFKHYTFLEKNIVLDKQNPIEYKWEYFFGF